MGFAVGPFAYAVFLVVFIKFNDASYDLRTSVHKTMGILSYLFIIVNKLTDSGMLVLDVLLFAVASFCFYRAVSDNLERVSRGGIATVLVAAGLIAGAYVRGAPSPASGARPAKSAQEIEAEAALKQILEQTAHGAAAAQSLEEAERRLSPTPASGSPAGR